MKIYRLFVILFVLTIIGCSSSGPDWEDGESNSSLSQIDISKTEISEASSETESVPEESDSQKEESASPEPTDEEFVSMASLWNCQEIDAGAGRIKTEWPISEDMGWIPSRVSTV